MPVLVLLSVAGLADLNHGGFNHDLNQVIFCQKKIMWFKSQMPVYFESPLCKNI